MCVCVCVCVCVKILKNKKKFLEIGNFLFKLGKKSPKSHWERGRITLTLGVRAPGSNTGESTKLGSWKLIWRNQL